MLTINIFIFFFFNAPATSEIYTLSLHDALPISTQEYLRFLTEHLMKRITRPHHTEINVSANYIEKNRLQERSEEHTSELQSRGHLVCRLLLEKKKNKKDK